MHLRVMHAGLQLTFFYPSCILQVVFVYNLNERSIIVASNVCLEQRVVYTNPALVGFYRAFALLILRVFTLQGEFPLYFLRV